VIGRLTKKPAIVGHSFGGLLTQILAGGSPQSGPAASPVPAVHDPEDFGATGDANPSP
jgi:hypothetical protein